MLAGEGVRVVKVAVGSDHAGFAGRQVAIRTLKELGIACIDLGAKEGESVDYPDYAHQVAEAVQSRSVDFGVLVCGTGQGMAMSANKHPGVRAAVITDDFTARMSRAHNDANVACFGERVIGAEAIDGLLRVFLDSAFENDRHTRRVAKIEP